MVKLNLSLFLNYYVTCVTILFALLRETVTLTALGKNKTLYSDMLEEGIYFTT